jgi:hypothetical protein
MDASTIDNYPVGLPLAAVASRKRASAQRALERAAQLTAEADALDQAALERRRMLEAAS